MSLVRGVDVSTWQPRLPWSSLTAEGCRFVFIRVGDGTIIDDRAAEHHADATAAGLLVGPYFFARDREPPAVQVDRFAQVAAGIGRWDFPLCVDFEAGSRTGAANPAVWLSGALDAVRRHHPGRRLPLYVDWYGLRDELGSVRLEDVVLWIPGGARYYQALRWADEPGPVLEAPPGRTTGIWQFTQHGRAGSYPGDLDLNVAELWAIDALVGRSTVSARARFVAAAQAWVGTVEQPPGSNNVPGITDCTGPTHWCFCAVWRWAEDAGLGLPRLNGACGITYCPSAVEHAYRHGEAVPVEQARAGDIVLFSWEPWAYGSDGVPRCTSAQWAGAVAGDHVGIVERDYDGSGWLTCVEGNTAMGTVGSQTDGIYVARRQRHISLVCCIWRPAALDADTAPAEPPFPDQPAVPGQAGVHVEALQRWLASRGRPDLNPGTVDGFYGTWTTIAVRNLQAIAWGQYVAEVDGVWGPLTIRRVADHLAGLPITDPPPPRHEPEPTTEEDSMILVRADDAPTTPDPSAAIAVWLIVGTAKMWVPDEQTFGKLGGAAAVRPMPWVMLNQLPAIGQTYPTYAGPRASTAAVDPAAVAADLRRALGQQLLVG